MDEGSRGVGLEQLIQCSSFESVREASIDSNWSNADDIDSEYNDGWFDYLLISNSFELSSEEERLRPVKKSAALWRQPVSVDFKASA